ncbi:MAG: hypothetical protein KAJ18_05465 [Candidatus Omnitrophica bacterium]|nr:hypothetical protein [Candidatus Omnitrophota bacterium]
MTSNIPQKNIVLILLILLSFYPLTALANTITNDRRIEEKKRINLQPTEAKIKEAPDEQPTASGLSSIDYDYFNNLIKKKHATWQDGLYIIALLLGDLPTLPSFDDQFTQYRSYLPLIKEQSNPDRLLTKGQIAFMLCNALNIKGGMHLRLFGASQRYALKELAYQDIMPTGSPRELISGEELTLTLINTIEYLERRQSAVKLKTKN